MSEYSIKSLLIGTGFSAMHSGQIAAAKGIFTSLAELATEDAAGSIGLASIALTEGNIQQAIALLETALAHADINRQEARKLLLISYMLEGEDSRAEQLHRDFVVDSACPAKQTQLDQAQQFFNQTA